MSENVKFIPLLSSKKDTLYRQEDPIPLPRIVVCENEEDARKVMREYEHYLSGIICLRNDNTWAIADSILRIQEIYNKPTK